MTCPLTTLSYRPEQVWLNYLLAIPGTCPTRPKRRSVQEVSFYFPFFSLGRLPDGHQNPPKKGELHEQHGKVKIQQKKLIINYFHPQQRKIPPLEGEKPGKDALVTKCVQDTANLNLPACNIPPNKSTNSQLYTWVWKGGSVLPHTVPQTSLPMSLVSENVVCNSYYFFILYFLYFFFLILPFFLGNLSECHLY